MPDAAFDYDYLIAGGGAAGLSLAYYLVQEPRLRDKRILLLEPEAKDQNDRTWSFWTEKPTPFDGIAVREWRQLAFRSPGFEQIFPLSRYRYQTIRGIDFYRFVHAVLAAAPQVTVVRASVESLENTSGGVTARTGAGSFAARYAFDSRPPKLTQRPDKYRYLLQHFIGWEVETEQDAFDPATVEFMDFRGAQHHEARFIYVLPFAPRRALVEYTLFSGRLLPDEAYEAALRDYLTNTLGLTSYRIVEREQGAIPMTDHPLPLRDGAHIINLGTRAGRAKPSTGYAFQRIQQHSEHLVNALASTGKPPRRLTTDQPQFRLFDTLLLDIMQRRGETTRDIFTELFQRNPLERMLDFLDEKTSWRENFLILNSVTSAPFLRSIRHVLRGRPGVR
ncbi:lycopene cyclase [Hymenobacter sp. BT175]|uniref:lycopene cyclase family protein n=1 Tax=Hymenobacter translucens TaxID=2886507 RepID=UPI001D0E0DEC|nr:lycopene cyclase family protein [Hymenobacter translucens]MCC2545913.1 lycopene cyclase [Hymenobacter translucens]